MTPLSLFIPAFIFACDGSDRHVDADTAQMLENSTLELTEGLPKNLLIISIDTLRADHIGALSGSDNTPFLDSLLEESVLHNNLRGCSNWTYSSLLCLMSGQSMVDLGFEPVTGDDESSAIPTQLDLLPLWLQEAGFETAAVTGSPWFRADSGVITGEGYDTLIYDDWGNPSVFPPASWTSEMGVEAAKQLLENDSERWYLQIHFMDPHTPYTAPAQYRAELEELESIPYDLTSPTGLQEAKNDFSSLGPRDQNLVLAHFKIFYSAEIRYLDDQLAEMWKSLADMGALDDTLVLFWSDHGEQFHEHMKWGHSSGLYQEENRALAAWWAPGLSSAVWDVPVQHQDLIHTIFKSLGLPAISSWTGQDPDTITEDKVRQAFRYNAKEDGWFMTTQDDYSLVYRCSGKQALFNVKEDPAELSNIYTEEDPTVMQLWEHMNSEIDRVLEYLPQLECVERGP